MTASPPLFAIASLLLAISSSNAFSWSKTHHVSRIQLPGATFACTSTLHASSESSDDNADDDGLIDESITQNPSGEIARLKAEMKVATDAGDMDKVMTLMGTLLALEGGYESEE